MPGAAGVRVKICGITRLEDAQAAQRYGADAIGFVFAERSRRHVSIAQAARISAGVGPFLGRVGVFVNAPPGEVDRAIAEARLTAVQFHGDETPEYARRFAGRVQVIRALPFTPDTTPAALAAYPADAILLDAAVPGSGVTFGWAQAAAWRGHPRLVLAGGLDPANVAAAVAALAPYAVDVSSGVEVSNGLESAPGVKSAELIERFVTAARTPLAAEGAGRRPAAERP